MRPMSAARLPRRVLRLLGTARLPSTARSARSARSTLTVGTATAVSCRGTYANGQDLVDAINSKVAGASRSVDSTTGNLSISSG